MGTQPVSGQSCIDDAAVCLTVNSCVSPARFLILQRSPLQLLGSGTWEIYRGNGSTGEKLAIVKKPHGLGKLASGTQHQGPVVNVHFASHKAAGGSIHPDMTIVGDVMGKGYQILQGSSMVAEVNPQNPHQTTTAPCYAHLSNYNMPGTMSYSSMLQMAGDSAHPWADTMYISGPSCVAEQFGAIRGCHSLLACCACKPCPS